jgi:hypothetical protein
LKAVFVESSIPAARPLDRLPHEIVQQGTVALLAAIVVLLGVMPNVLASRILAAVP